MRVRLISDMKGMLVCIPYSKENLESVLDEFSIPMYFLENGLISIPSSRRIEIESKCEKVSSNDLVKIINGEYVERLTYLTDGVYVTCFPHSQAFVKRMAKEFKLDKAFGIKKNLKTFPEYYEIPPKKKVDVVYKSCLVSPEILQKVVDKKTLYFEGEWIDITPEQLTRIKNYGELNKIAPYLNDNEKLIIRKYVEDNIK